MKDPRYPIGKFEGKDSYSAEEVKQNISRIEALPAALTEAIRNLTAAQLDTPYRDGGWTVRQVVHHVPDSHLNAYVRTKWALTENTPIIKAYDEKLWAETPESKADPEVSLTFLRALHAKWTSLLRQLSPTDLSREFHHPVSKTNQRLDRLIAMYAWHGEHHVAHITELKKAKEWK